MHNMCTMGAKKRDPNPRRGRKIVTKVVDCASGREFLAMLRVLRRRLLYGALHHLQRPPNIASRPAIHAASRAHVLGPVVVFDHFRGFLRGRFSAEAFACEPFTPQAPTAIASLARACWYCTHIAVRYASAPGPPSRTSHSICARETGGGPCSARSRGEM